MEPPPSLQESLETAQPTPAERRWGALAHAGGVFIGLPLIFLGLRMGIPSPFVYIPATILAYLIARSFRGRRQVWGSFQGMQATVAHLFINLLLFVILFSPDDSRLFMILPLLVIIAWIYTLWAAWDTLFGEDFRYILISRLLYRVSETNLQRPQRRRRFFRPYTVDGSSREDDDRNRDDRPRG